MSGGNGEPQPESLQDSGDGCKLIRFRFAGSIDEAVRLLRVVDDWVPCVMVAGLL
jgi:hypothetical protein